MAVPEQAEFYTAATNLPSENACIVAMDVLHAKGVDYTDVEVPQTTKGIEWGKYKAKLFSLLRQQGDLTNDDLAVGFASVERELAAVEAARTESDDAGSAGLGGLALALGAVGLWLWAKGKL